MGIVNWDVMLIGDGSGTGWKMGCGWASILIDKETRRRKLFYGGMSSGTIAMAELLPYLHAMEWYDHYRKDIAAKSAAPLHVRIITDNRAIFIQGNQLRDDPQAIHRLKSNQRLWSAMLAFEREGYIFDFTWAPRNKIALNMYADKVAGHSRLIMEKVTLPTKRVSKKDKHGKSVTMHEPVSIYDVNFNDYGAMGRKVPNIKGTPLS